jgi:hypothetical protein
MIHITRPTGYNANTLSLLEKFLTGPELRLTKEEYCISGNLNDEYYRNSLKAIFIIENYLSTNNKDGNVVGEGCYRIFEKAKSRTPVYFITIDRVHKVLYIDRIKAVSPKNDPFYGYSHCIICSSAPGSHSLLTAEYVQTHIFRNRKVQTEKANISEAEKINTDASAIYTPNYLLISSLKR